MKFKGIILLIGSLFYGGSMMAQITKTMFKMPDTGANTSYTNTFGEDNDYQINMPKFKVFANGTVLDSITGLMWQQTDGGEMTVESARKYVDTLTLGGYSDWRLPLAGEAYSILNQQDVNPAIDVKVFTKTAAEYWWTADRQANDSTRIWVTNSGGGIGNHPKSESLSAGGAKLIHVRAVRQKFPTINVQKRFAQVGTSATVVDSLSMLQWQKVPSTTTMTWEDAITYAENLVQDGYSDWRLPNVKEIRSLNVETKVQPSADNSIFSITNSQKYWASTTLPNKTTYAWYWSTQFGITTYDLKTTLNSVICVRTADGKLPSTNVGAQKLNQTSVQIIPNPATSWAIVKSNQIMKSVTILNLSGQTIAEINCGATQLKLDIEMLPEGIYYLAIQMGDGKLLNSKLIKNF